MPAQADFNFAEKIVACLSAELDDSRVLVLLDHALAIEVRMNLANSPYFVIARFRLNQPLPEHQAYSISSVWCGLRIEAPARFTRHDGSKKYMVPYQDSFVAYIRTTTQPLIEIEDVMKSGMDWKQTIDRGMRFALAQYDRFASMYFCWSLTQSIPD